MVRVACESYSEPLNVRVGTLPMGVHFPASPISASRLESWVYFASGLSATSLK